MFWLIWGGDGGVGAEEKLNSGSLKNLHFAKYRMWRPERRSIGYVLPVPSFVINTVNEAEGRHRDLLHEDCRPAGRPSGVCFVVGQLVCSAY